MSGKSPAYEHGPVPYQVSAAVAGGQCVIVDTANAGKVKASTGAPAELFLGIATTDGAPVAAPNDGYTNPVIINPLPDTIAVDDAPRYWVLKTTGALTFGQDVTTGAAGTVDPAAAGDRVIGYCAEPGGIIAGASGLIKIGGHPTI